MEGMVISYVISISVNCWSNFIWIVLGDLRVIGGVTLSIKRATISTRICSHPDCSQRSNLRVVPRMLRRNILKHHRFYVPKLARACPIHLVGESWTKVSSSNSANIFTIEQIEDMIDLLRSDPGPGENMLTSTYFTQKYFSHTAHV